MSAWGSNVFDEDYISLDVRRGESSGLEERSVSARGSIFSSPFAASPAPSSASTPISVFSTSRADADFATPFSPFPPNTARPSLSHPDVSFNLDRSIDVESEIEILSTPAPAPQNKKRLSLSKSLNPRFPVVDIASLIPKEEPTKKTAELHVLSTPRRTLVEVKEEPHTTVLDKENHKQVSVPVEETTQTEKSRQPRPANLDVSFSFMADETPSNRSTQVEENRSVTPQTTSAAYPDVSFSMQLEEAPVQVSRVEGTPVSISAPVEDANVEISMNNNALDEASISIHSNEEEDAIVEFAATQLTPMNAEVSFMLSQSPPPIHANQEKQDREEVDNNVEIYMEEEEEKEGKKAKGGKRGRKSKKDTAAVEQTDAIDSTAPSANVKKTKGKKTREVSVVREKKKEKEEEKESEEESEEEPMAASFPDTPLGREYRRRFTEDLFALVPATMTAFQQAKGSERGTARISPHYFALNWSKKFGGTVEVTDAVWWTRDLLPVIESYRVNALNALPHVDTTPEKEGAPIDPKKAAELVRRLEAEKIIQDNAEYLSRTLKDYVAPLAHYASLVVAHCEELKGFNAAAVKSLVTSKRKMNRTQPLTGRIHVEISPFVLTLLDEIGDLSKAQQSLLDFANATLEEDISKRMSTLGIKLSSKQKQKLTTSINEKRGVKRKAEDKDENTEKPSNKRSKKENEKEKEREKEESSVSVKAKPKEAMREKDERSEIKSHKVTAEDREVILSTTSSSKARSSKKTEEPKPKAKDKASLKRPASEAPASTAPASKRARVSDTLNPAPVEESRGMPLDLSALSALLSDQGDAWSAIARTSWSTARWSVPACASSTGSSSLKPSSAPLSGVLVGVRVLLSGLRPASAPQRRVDNLHHVATLLASLLGAEVKQRPRALTHSDQLSDEHVETQVEDALKDGADLNRARCLVLAPDALSSVRTSIAAAMRIPIVHVDWLIDCAKAGKRLPINGYLLPYGRLNDQAVYPRLKPSRPFTQGDLPFMSRQRSGYAMRIEVVGFPEFRKQYTKVLQSAGAMVTRRLADFAPSIHCVLSDSQPSESIYSSAMRLKLPMFNVTWLHECLLRGHVVLPSTQADIDRLTVKPPPSLHVYQSRFAEFIPEEKERLVFTELRPLDSVAVHEDDVPMEIEVDDLLSQINQNVAELDATKRSDEDEGDKKEIQSVADVNESVVEFNNASMVDNHVDKEVSMDKDIGDDLEVEMDAAVSMVDNTMMVEQGEVEALKESDVHVDMGEADVSIGSERDEGDQNDEDNDKAKVAPEYEAEPDDMQVAADIQESANPSEKKEVDKDTDKIEANNKESEAEKQMPSIEVEEMAVLDEAPRPLETAEDAPALEDQDAESHMVS